ncbi:aldehyde oxidase GLOX-like [Ananas comosus]|uniref:Aldehyde oxidase GLOX-like n=1 Tax=Ananas comosus TaxID=4615 RepID=A0A6P5EDN6_ANACO|nr:aldehyde oxidase GLOX-like [Ananas comosus]
MQTIILLLFLVCFAGADDIPDGGADGILDGGCELLQRSIGVSAMHMQLLHTDHVIVFDRTDFGRSNLSLPRGICRHDPTERVLKVDCTAHSAEYDVVMNSFRPLMILTDTWCSSGAVAPNGTLIQTGGWSDGEQAIRLFTPCTDTRCDWSEDALGLSRRRWYASNQILPDGRVIVVGGGSQFNYELLSNGNSKNFFSLHFLQETSDPEENNLYPFVHLNVDGKLFIFANNRAILFDYENQTVVPAPIRPRLLQHR